MAWFIVAYGIASLVAGGMAMTASFWTGAALIAASGISLTLFGGLKAVLFRYESEHRLAYMIGTVLAGGLAAWLAQHVRFVLFSMNMPGWEWCMIGASLSAIYASIDRDELSS